VLVAYRPGGEYPRPASAFITLINLDSEDPGSLHAFMTLKFALWSWLFTGLAE
jgi:hypothetical protein